MSGLNITTVGSLVGREHGINLWMVSDPNVDFDEDEDAVISEPPLGADKIYYRIGFDENQKNGGSDASEGDTITVTQVGLVILTPYETLHSL